MTAQSPADLAALKARLYAALKHEKSCLCGECSGGLNAVDALVARCQELEREVELANFDGHYDRAVAAEAERDEKHRLWHEEMGTSAQADSDREEMEARAEAAEAELAEYKTGPAYQTVVDALRAAEAERDEARGQATEAENERVEWQNRCAAAEARVAQLEARIAAMPYETEEELSRRVAELEAALGKIVAVGGAGGSPPERLPRLVKIQGIARAALAGEAGV